MNYFDTHAHIGLIHEDPIEQLLIVKEAAREGVKGIISICNNLRDFPGIYENLSSAKNVYFSAGVSPSEVEHPGKDWQYVLTGFLKQDKVVALGETGLDYYKKYGDKNSQIELFINQLEIAEHYNLPVIIHNRNAGDDILDILKTKLPSRGGVLHCFSENWAFAQEALRLHENLYISFAGNLTYKNAKNLHETVAKMPLERIVIESESPFMVPAEHRGKRNKPKFLPSTADFIAQVKDTELETICDALYENSLRLFNIDAK